MVSRRGVIASALGASAMVALTACSAEVSEPTVEPTPEDSISTAPTGPIEVAKTSEIPVGGGARFTVQGQDILITQPKSGEFRAFSAICTHAGFVMSRVTDSEIVCDNHGAVYNAEDGSVIKGPAPRALGKISVEVSGDAVLVSF